MLAGEITRIEDCLGIRLPDEYRSVLASSEYLGIDDDTPEFIADAQTLIGYNYHLVAKREDEPPRGSKSAWGALKSLFLRRYEERRLARRRAWFDEWQVGRRFVVGSDLSEERYFIVLTERPLKVYCFELETGRSYVVAESLEHWLSTVRLRQSENADAE